MVNFYYNYSKLLQKYKAGPLKLTFLSAVKPRSRMLHIHYPSSSPSASSGRYGAQRGGFLVLRLCSLPSICI
jgi:hypothetical protein